MIISLPPLERSQEITGTLVFRPKAMEGSKALPGDKLFTRYSLKYDDAAKAGWQRLSNGVAFVFGEAGSNQDVSKGQIQLLEPSRLVIKGVKVKV